MRLPWIIGEGETEEYSSSYRARESSRVAKSFDLRFKRSTTISGASREPSAWPGSRPCPPLRTTSLKHPKFQGTTSRMGDLDRKEGHRLMRSGDVGSTYIDDGSLQVSWSREECNCARQTPRRCCGGQISTLWLATDHDLRIFDPSSIMHTDREHVLTQSK